MPVIRPKMFLFKIQIQIPNFDRIVGNLTQSEYLGNQIQLFKTKGISSMEVRWVTPRVPEF